jgi:hypothetical protein
MAQELLLYQGAVPSAWLLMLGDSVEADIKWRLALTMNINFMSPMRT